MPYKKGHKTNVGRIRAKKPFCIHGHEIVIVGRDKQGKCRECGRLHVIKWRKNNPEKVKASSKKSGKKQYEKDRESRKEISRRWRTANPDKARIIERNATWRQAGITNIDGTFFTTKDFGRAKLEQCNKCAICGEHQSNLKVTLNADHDHKTGIFRGLVCSGCNTKIGTVESDKFELVIAYLKQFKNG